LEKDNGGDFMRQKRRRTGVKGTFFRLKVGAFLMKKYAGKGLILAE
jgi:hypothetical protein